MNDIYLSKIVNQTTEFSEEEIELLQSIAVQCPSEGGMSVFRARIALPDCDHTEYDDCENSIDNRSVSRDLVTINKKDIDIFPNPSTGNFIISLADSAEGELKIVTPLGVSIYNKTFNSKIIEVDLNSYKGMFFCYFKFKDDSVVTKSLIVHE